MSDERLNIVKALIEVSLPLDTIKRRLKEYGWDYQGKKIELRADHLIKILNDYINGRMSAIDVEKWADLVECRDDIKYETDAKEWLDEVISELANPAMSPPLDISRAKVLIAGAPTNSAEL